MRRSFVAVLVLLAAGARAAAGSPVTGTPATVAAPDGTKLAVTYYAGDAPGPGILLLHQCNRDRSVWKGLAESLARAGFHVLTLDYRGYGESGGQRHLDLTGLERTRIVDDVWPGDVDAAYAYLRHQKGVQGVFGAGGASCGVNQSIQLSRRHPEVKSLVLLSGNTNAAGRRFLKTKTSPPLFLAAADDDDGVVEIVAWIEASSNNPVNRFVEYKTGGHGADLFQPHPELPGQIVAWYEATLAGRGRPASTDNRARRDAPRLRLLRMTDEPGGFGRVADTLDAERKKDPTSPVLEAEFVNFLGYAALNQDDAKGAVAILKINVEDHPESANAWDSVGDAYLADGQRDQARAAAEKALKLLDADKSVSDQTRQEIRESAQAKLGRLETTPVP